MKNVCRNGSNVNNDIDDIYMHHAIFELIRIDLMQ